MPRWTEREEIDQSRVAQRQQPRSSRPPDNIFTRIAYSDNNNLNKVQDFLVTNGIRKAKNNMDLATMLFQLSKKHGDELIPSLIELHPDKKYFEAHYGPMLVSKDVEINKLKEEAKSLSSELRSAKDELAIASIKQKYNNAEGGAPIYIQPPSNSQENSKGSIENHFPFYALVGVVGIIGLSMIALSHHKK